MCASDLIAAGSASIAGSAAHISVHDATGDLLADAATVIGAALRTDAGVAGLAEAVWHYQLSNGLTAEQTLVQAWTLLNELHLIHGLKLGSPLTVTPTSRVAGLVSQTIVAPSEDNVTVTRQ